MKETDSEGVPCKIWQKDNLTTSERFFYITSRINML